MDTEEPELSQPYQPTFLDTLLLVLFALVFVGAIVGTTLALAAKFP